MLISWLPETPACLFARPCLPCDFCQGQGHVDRLQQLLDRADALGVDMTEHTTRIRQVSRPAVCCCMPCRTSSSPPRLTRRHCPSCSLLRPAASETLLRVSAALVGNHDQLHGVQAAGGCCVCAVSWHLCPPALHHARSWPCCPSPSLSWGPPLNTPVLVPSSTGTVSCSSCLLPAPTRACLAR